LVQQLQQQRHPSSQWRRSGHRRLYPFTQNLSRFIELAEASVLPGVFAADSVSAIGIKQTCQRERGFNFCDWWTVNSSRDLIGVPVTAYAFRRTFLLL
jgi:hypothetical protein